MMVGRLLSCWDGNFSGAMLNFQGVKSHFTCVGLKNRLGIHKALRTSEPPKKVESCNYHPSRCLQPPRDTMMSSACHDIHESCQDGRMLMADSPNSKICSLGKSVPKIGYQYHRVSNEPLLFFFFAGCSPRSSLTIMRSCDGVRSLFRHRWKLFLPRGKHFLPRNGSVLFKMFENWVCRSGENCGIG